MGLFDWIGSDPSKAAGKYLKQIPSMAHGVYDPFAQQGQRIGNLMESQFGNLLNDPGGMINKIGSSFQQSPGFQFALNQALQGANHAAAAGGMAGSPAHQQQNMALATDLANQNYMPWLQNALQMYGGGLSGAQGMYGTGANAASNLAQMLGGNLQDRASNAYTGAQWKNKMNLGLTGLGLTGAFDYFGNRNNPSSGSQSSAFSDASKLLPLVMAML